MEGPKLRQEALRADLELQVGVEFVETELSAVLQRFVVNALAKDSILV